MGAVKAYLFGEFTDEQLNPSCPNCGSKDVTGEGKLCPTCWKEVQDDKRRHEAEEAEFCTYAKVLSMR